MLSSINFNQAIQYIIILLIAIDLHELAHAVVATKLGDPTPARNGQLSLNPFVHMDQFGVLLLVVTSLFGTPFTWGRTFVQPQNLKFGPQRGGALVAMAGPLTNLALAVVIGLFLRFDASALPVNWLTFAYYAFVINLILFALNLLPIPPLDGFTIVTGALTPRQMYAIAPIRQYGPLVLLLIILVPSILCDTVYRLVDYIGPLILPGFFPIC
jgi:Zn-dependent protease